MSSHASPPPSPDARLRRRLLRGLAVLGGLGVVAALLLFLTPSGRDLMRWTGDQLRVEEVRGRIVDATTGAGVPGAVVVVSSFNGLWTPSLVGDVAHGVATTDAEGGFIVPHQRLGNTRISARAAGYATIYQVKLREVDTDVVLPTAPAAAGEVEHRAEVGFDLASALAPAYFDVVADSVVADAAAADFAFAVDPAVPAQVIVTALGQGGLAVETPPPGFDHAIDPLAARCLAPDSGYAAADTVQGNVSTSLYFARSRDGSRFSRIKLRVYGRGPTPQHGYRVEIERWLNPTGGRNVCAVPVEGERYEFAAAERKKR